MYTADQYSLITARKQKNNQRCPEQKKKKVSCFNLCLRALYCTEFEKIFSNINSNMYREIKMKPKSRKKYPSNKSYMFYTLRK